MEWFRRIYPAHQTEAKPPSRSVDREALPSREGLVTGLLGSVKTKAKDGYATSCEGPLASGREVFVYRTLLAACGAAAGDWLAFGVHESADGQPQASAPLWRCLACHPRDGANGTFPRYMGIVSSVAPSGDCGHVDSPEIQEAFGKSVFVQKALLGSLTAGDAVAFDVRVNGKGNPQAAPPLFKLFARSPCLSPQKSPGLGPQKSPGLRPHDTTVPRPDRSRRSLVKSACSSAGADWAAFPQVLLPRALAAAGPTELCRLAVACRDWRESLDLAEADLEGFWKALCEELYPTMAAKLAAAEAAGDASFGESLPPPRQEEEEEEEAEEGAAEENAEAAAAPLEQPADVCAGQRVAGGGSPELRSALPKGPGERGGAPAEGPFWRRKFLQRHLKQRAWDAERLEQQRLKLRRAELHRQQALAEDKQRGQNFRGQASQSDAKTQRTMRSVRTRTCRRCGAIFQPGGSSAADACCWHRGQYARVDEDGVMEAGAPQMNRATVQRMIKANTQKKRSKQANALFLSDCNGRPSQERWAWTCCGAENLVAGGCCSGAHT